MKSALGVGGWRSSVNFALTICQCGNLCICTSCSVFFFFFLNARTMSWTWNGSLCSSVFSLAYNWPKYWDVLQRSLNGISVFSHVFLIAVSYLQKILLALSPAGNYLSHTLLFWSSFMVCFTSCFNIDTHRYFIFLIIM